MKELSLPDIAREAKQSLVSFLLGTFLFYPLLAIAEDQIDVDGGFFDPEMMKEDILDSGRQAPEERQPKRGEEDSWTVKEEQIEKAKNEFVEKNERQAEAKKKLLEEQLTEEKLETKPEAVTLPPASKHEEILNHTQKVMEQVKELQHQGGNKSIPSVIDMLKNNNVKSNNAGAAVQATGAGQPGVEKNKEATVLGKGIFPDSLAEQGSPPVSLIVSAKPLAHCLEQLERIGEVHQEKRVPIGQIVILGADQDFPLYTSGLKQDAKNTQGSRKASKLSVKEKLGMLKSSPLTKFIESNQLSTSSMITAEEVIKRFSVKASPVWVVRHRGIDYMFPGAHHPRDFYNAKGQFLYADEKQTPVGDRDSGAFIDSKIPVVLGKMAGGGVKLPDPIKMEYKLTLPDDVKKRLSLPSNAVNLPAELTALTLKPKYSQRSTKEPSSGVASSGFALPKLPSCEKSNVFRKQVFHYTPLTNHLDAVYFSPAEDAQQAQAEKWKGHKVIYRGGTTIEPANPTQNPFPMIGVISRMRCLPTRLHFITETGKRFIEYREGAAAWKDTTTKKAPENGAQPNVDKNQGMPTVSETTDETWDTGLSEF